MKPRRPSALTSPAPCGAFLFLSASPCNRPAFAPPLPRAAALPAALPLCPVRPLPPRLGTADKPRRPCAAQATAGDPCRRPRAGRATSAALSLCRFPCPAPPLPRAGIGKPRPASFAPLAKARQPRAAGRCRCRCRPGRAKTAAGRPPVIQTAAAPPAS